MTAASTGQAPAGSLAELRGELRMAASDERTGGSCQVIFDPLRQRYFRIDAEAAELLSLWPSCRTADELAVKASERFGHAIDKAQIEALSRFLEGNGLTDSSESGAWQKLAGIERSGRHGWLAWTIHNYLFVRLPLLRPEPMLIAALPWVRPLYSRTCALVVALIGLAGLHLVLRQWDQFVGSFPYFFSAEGALLYGLALCLVKSLHELGHALTAVRFGCRVPTMGLCFMVLCPMLYTDVSDAWKLPSRRQRLAIDAAGLIVETALACLATFLWAFLPDGPARSLAFAVATTGWLLSLGLNLNPFMRFDGYYMLSDATGIENLQPRAFAFGRWQMREWLFGLDRPPPEPMPAVRRRWLVLYAFATWIYRLVVFTGIALFVYQATFKLLGIALFAVEIIYFIAWPLAHEIREWTAMRAEIFATRRSLATFVSVALLGALLAVPWSSRVTIPAIVEDADIAQLYSVRTASVVAAPARLGQVVAAGDLIVALASPELEQEMQRTRLKLRLLKLRFARRAADTTDRAESLVLEDMIASLGTKLAGLEAEQRELRVVAPHAGVVAEIDSQLQAGRWLQRTDLIAVIRGGGERIARGYVAEEDVDRLDPAAPAHFVPEQWLRATLPVTLLPASPAAVASIDILELASPYGGAIAARPLQRAREGRLLVPVAGQTLVTGTIAAEAAGVSWPVARGTIIATGRAESFATRAWRQILKVLVRESGV